MDESIPALAAGRESTTTVIVSKFVQPVMLLESNKMYDVVDKG